MIVDLTVVRKFMTASSAGVNSGSAPNSDSNMRSRSSWLPATRIYSFIKCTAGQWFMVTIRIWNILSLLLLGLVCSSFKTSGIDGMDFRRSSISALASEPAETIMWALQFKSHSTTQLSQWFRSGKLPLSTTISRDPLIIGFLALLLPLLFDDTL